MTGGRGDGLAEGGRAPSMMEPVAVVAVILVLCVLFVGLPALAGPPSLAAPLSSLAWAPLAFVVGVIVFVATVMTADDALSMVARRHARTQVLSDLALPIVPFSAVGVATGWALGGETWGYLLGLVGGMICGIGWGVGSDLVRAKLVATGWVHYQSDGCCERTQPNPIDGVNRESGAGNAPPGEAIAFMGDASGKEALLAALARQRERGAVALDQGEAAVDFRIRVGCPVPCERRHYATDGEPEREMDEHHRLYRALYGVPAPLSGIENTVFSNLPLAAAAEWPERFVAALRPGAELGAVSERWALWLLSAEDSPIAAERAQFEALAVLLERRIAGDEPRTDEWLGLVEFAESESWIHGNTERIIDAMARAGGAAAESDAARDLSLAATLAGRLAAQLRRRATEAAQHRAAVESRNPIAGSLAWARRNFSSYEGETEREWEQMADQLIEEVARA